MILLCRGDIYVARKRQSHAAGDMYVAPTQTRIMEANR
ncbi:MAG: hypothetical protein JWM57_823 [Phycisphaerales bacterium]|nr:hypothetical protein [Phycisphaerales bacterium]